MSDAPNLVELIRGTVDQLHVRFFEPLPIHLLYRDAWEGAAAALARAGATSLPAPPDFPDDPAAAHEHHARVFPLLEQRAASTLSRSELGAAALRELLNRRRDGHTFLMRAGELHHPSPGPRSYLGLALTDSPPLTVAAVVPGGPAQRAGIRRGQVVHRINGQSCATLRRSEAASLLDRGVGTANDIIVAAGGSETTSQVRSESFPRISSSLLPGPIGLLRIDGFAGTDDETAELRAALTSFQDAGAIGWIVDVRWCGGGYSGRFSQLLVPEGRIFARLRHNHARFADGSVHPQRENIDANGTALPFQRPLVVLIGPGSISGAESFAGPMQARGRATLVGERTAGACGFGSAVRPADGWSMLVTARETVFGPQEHRFNRIGVPPDVPVTPTPDDEATGRDPQLETALELLRSS